MGNFLLTDRDREIMELEKLFGKAPYGGDNTGGFLTQGDVLYVTSDGIDPNALWDEAQQALTYWNQDRNKLVSILTFDVVNEIEEVPQVGEATFELASEMGVPQGESLELGYFNLGYDFKDYDRATRFTWRYIRNADSRAIRAINNALLQADDRLIFRKVMESIFDNRNRTAKIRGNRVPVYSLYNADGTIPPPYHGVSFDGNHNHYMVSGNTNVDSGDVEDAYENIREHGYSLENGTQIVLLANRAMLKKMQHWRAGQVSANGVVANYDFIPSANRPTLILDTALGMLGNIPPDQWNGLKTFGSYDDIILVEESFIPDNYFLMFGSGGLGNLQNLVGFRQHQNAAYQGLKLMSGNTQGYPLIESFYTRGFGTGIRQRAGAVVMQITGNGSYTVPEQYDSTSGVYVA